jgi:hypothetical protein
MGFCTLCESAYLLRLQRSMDINQVRRQENYALALVSTGRTLGGVGIDEIVAGTLRHDPLKSSVGGGLNRFRMAEGHRYRLPMYRSKLISAFCSMLWAEGIAMGTFCIYGTNRGTYN